ncbi:MAG: NINE protein [Bacteroidia bacterium]
MMRFLIAILFSIAILIQKSSAVVLADDFLFNTNSHQCLNTDSVSFFKYLIENNISDSKIKWAKAMWYKSYENPRLYAFCIAVLLGPFGAHRIYLGTNHMVPVAYTLTLGGGLGIIPVIDAILILATKNLEPYQNNPRFFMWTSKDIDED